MKKYFFFFVCLLVGNSLFSQGYVFNIFGNRKGVDKSSAVIVGLKGGVSSANMHYSNSELNSLTKNVLLRPDYGLFVEMPMKNDFAVGVDLLVAGKGVDVSYNSHGDSDYPVKYTVKSTYLDLRVPVSYKFAVTYSFMPFVYVAPYLSYRMGGTISLEQKSFYEYDDDINQSIDIGDANMQMFDFGAVVGGGLRYDFNFPSFSIVTKLEVGYNFGMLNTFSKKEQEDGFGTAPVNNGIVNVNAYNTQGKRFNRGVEAMITIGLPLKFRERDCSNFKGKGKKGRIY
ncbi:MAG: PorT family protein [Bacteroidales bacterium]|nr:PorT family protein [Bacteroidales bacterium]